MREDGQVTLARRLLTSPVIGWALLGAGALGIAGLAIEAALGSTLYGIPVALAFLVALLHAAALPLAVHRPVLGGAAAVLGVWLTALLTVEVVELPWPWPIAVMVVHSVALALIGASTRPAVGMLTWLTAIAGTIALAMIFPHGDAASINVIIATSVTGGALGVGIGFREWNDIREQLLQAKRSTAEEHEGRVLAEEKARIARELHDVVAHSMSVVTVQAASAPYRHEGVSEAVAAEFDDIAAATRRALAELRGLLGVLRADDAATELAPQPRLGDIPALVEATSRSGIDIAFAFSGDPESADDIAGLTAYRIVQEALANAIRHAPGSVVSVDCAAGAEVISIEVTNSTPLLPVPESAPGQGLIGMRERVTGLGGTLHTGPTPDGGFAVRASLPLRRFSA